MKEIGKSKSLISSRPKPRRKPKKFGDEAFDVVFDVLPRTKGSDGDRRTLSRVHIVRTFNDALNLKPKAVVMVLEMIKANDMAIYKARSRMRSPVTDEFGDFEFGDPGNANRALVILNIATIKKRVPDSGPPPLIPPSPLMLEPWAVEVGLKRYGKRQIDPADIAAIKRHMRKPDEDCECWMTWPSLPEPAPRRPERPKGRSFEEQKFQPGQSGNSKGRPRRPKYDVPYPFLNAIGLVSIDGQDYRMSRGQAFLRRIATATFPPESSLPQTIAKLMIDVTMQRWRRPPTELPVYEVYMPGRLNFSGCMEFLFLARKLNRMRACRRMVIEPWLVEMALDNLREEAPLSLIEQRTVVEATRTPWKVQWPGYWQVDIPKRRASPNKKAGDPPVFRG